MLFVGLACAFAAPTSPAIDLADSTDPVSLVEHLLVLKQAPATTSPDTDVLTASGWLPATEKNRNSSWIANTVWLTGLVHNSSAVEVTRWIVVQPWRIRDVQLYVLAPEGLRALDHQVSGQGVPLALRAQHHVEPVFPVTLPPGATVRLLIRAQDMTVPTVFIHAWRPDAYTQALTQQLVRETVTIASAMALLAMLLWVRDWSSALLAGWLVVSVGFDLTYQGQLLVYLVPSAAGKLIPVFTMLGTLSYILFSLTSRVMLGIGRQGLWAWVFNGLNTLAMLAAVLTLFTEHHLILRRLVNTIGVVIVMVWPVAAWQTPLPSQPGAKALRRVFSLCCLAMALTILSAGGGALARGLHIGQVRFTELTILCVLLVYGRMRQNTLASNRQQTEFMAFHDALTGLPNRVQGRNLLLRAMAGALRKGTSAGVLYLDLDKFKQVNDTHGHAAGDALLKAVAPRLRQCLGGADTLCRLSGDEFMVVMPDIDTPDRITRQCKRILAQFAQPFDVDNVQIFISCSIGAAICPADGENAEDLMRHADTALFEAKKMGENRFQLFRQEMRAQQLAHASTRNDLRQAVERQEFVLHYQPQVSLRSGLVVGVEALIRWNRPDHGLTPPDEFIAVAEESGLIVPIGAWVLREACRQTVAWHAAGWSGLKVAVNVSTVQFQSGHLCQDVQQALQESGLPPGCLELELTESVFFGCEQDGLQTVVQLKSMGLRLSIDDFGTGYSSLSYLQRFRFDKIKIDRSFITSLGQGPDEQAIVRAIVQMAGSLNIRTVAEGTENAQVVYRLALLGCDEAQGHHFSPPLSAPALARWLAKTQPVAALTPS